MTLEAPARRFLHMCYCCDDTDEVVDFLVNVLDMREVMRNPLHPSDGSLLGIDGEIVSGAAFVYDKRGPRTSPSIEVQEWVRPTVIGEPMSDPTHVGMQSLGVAVPHLDQTIARMLDAGCREVSRGATDWTGTWVTLADPTGTLFDLLEDATIPEGESRMRHLRITVTDLDVSLPWYEGLGFIELARHAWASGSHLGIDAGAADVVRLRLPDEPCEVVLVQWTTPRSHGRHPEHANQAGLFRTAVGVDDTVKSYNEFLAAGWTFEREPRQVELSGTKVPDMWICFLNDPDGVPFEFVQRPRSAFRP
ncbi:MAG: VOC family protein [Actinomycetota bacterium]